MLVPPCRGLRASRLVPLSGRRGCSVPGVQRWSGLASGVDVEGGADARGPLPHPEDPVGVEPPGLPDREALAVVGDLEAAAVPSHRQRT